MAQESGAHRLVGMTAPDETQPERTMTETEGPDGPPLAAGADGSPRLAQERPGVQDVLDPLLE